jgi:flagellar protein FlbD
LAPAAYSLGLIKKMIKVTRLNGVAYYLNPHQIEYIEMRPDTTFFMLSGKSVVVKESVDEVINRIVDYRKRIGFFKNEE